MTTLFATALLCGTVLLGTAAPARAALDQSLARDNIASVFDYWPRKGNKAQEYETSAGHQFRVWSPQLTPTVGGRFPAGEQQVEAPAGGLLVVFNMDHVIANADDDNAVVTMTFDASGNLIGMNVGIEPSKGALGIETSTGVAAAVGGAVATAGPAGAAAALIGKAVGEVGQKLGRLTNLHGGTLTFPAQIGSVSQNVARAVQAAAAGQRVQHEGRAIQGWEGNGCRQDQAGYVSGDRRSMRLTDRGSPFPNDEVRSLRIYNNVAPGTLIQVFDDSGGSHDRDDWAEIVVDDPKAFGSVGECVATFERNRQATGIRVFYYRQRGAGDLDGKVSRISVFPPGQWTDARRVQR